MGNYSFKNIDFCKQALIQKMSRPAPALAIYPKNTPDTQLLIRIVDGGTVIAIRYIASTVTNVSVTYTNKSVEEVVQEINQLTLPIEAAVVYNAPSLRAGDLVPLGANHIQVPRGFSVYDRIDSDGVIIRSKRVVVKHKSNSKIKALSPYFNSPSVPWYPRILNGSFSQEYKGQLYHFYIPEYEGQSWSSKYGKPFKDVFGVRPIKLSENSYQLPRYPVYWNGLNVTVYNGDVPLTSNVIEDIDINNGILYTKPGVLLREDFKIDYSYLENSFEYKGINLNGHFTQNPLVLDKYVVIYALPAESNQVVNKRTIYHAIGDSVDAAVNGIALSDPNIPVAIIGAYNVRQLFSTDKVSILDTRGKGGGLVDVNGPTSPIHAIGTPLESDEEQLEERYDEAYRFWDIGHYDGDAYPGAAAVAVDLPLELQDVMSLSDIK